MKAARHRSLTYNLKTHAVHASESVTLNRVILLLILQFIMANFRSSSTFLRRSATAALRKKTVSYRLNGPFNARGIYGDYYGYRRS